MEYEPFEIIEDETSHTLLRCRYCGTLVHITPEPPDDPNEDWNRAVEVMDLAESHLDECPALANTRLGSDDDDIEDLRKAEYEFWYGDDDIL